jgi:hypothetical protein
MSNFLKTIYDTEGPFGLPMKDTQAKALEKILPSLPEGAVPRFVTLEKAPAELLPGDRADISWITTESVDRDREVIIARGMDDSHFKLNPIVTLQHCYSMPPVGRSVWRKKAMDGDMKGIKARTQYPKKPAGWPQTDDWPPDVTFTLIQSGLLQGKSIGFLPQKCHAPTEDEIKKNPEWAGVRRIIDEWLLLEYACVYLPCQQEAVVEAVSKGIILPEAFADLFQIPRDLLSTRTPPRTLDEEPRTPQPSAPIPFTPWEEIEKSITRKINLFNFEELARKSVAQGIDRAKGRV